MVGSRPSKEAAKKMGMVPYTGDGSASGGSGYVDNSGFGNTYSKGDASQPAGYPNANNGGYSNQGNAVPPNATGNGNYNQQQVWAQGSGGQGQQPTWPTNEKGAPLHPNNSWQNRSANESGPAGPQNSNYTSNGYVQPPQNVNNFGPQRTISDGIPVNNNGNPVNNNGNWQNHGAPQNFVPQQNWQAQGGGQGQISQGPQQNWQAQGGQGQISQGPQQRTNVPKGDYVYYDGNGNQIQPNGAPGPNGNPNEKHFHHHYYSTSNHHHQQQQLPYQVKKKSRSPAAAALVGALATCWVCTWCCHPCC